MQNKNPRDITICKRCETDTPKGVCSNILNTILFGKYQILSVLGIGGSSTVYLARHLKLKSYRAIKCLPKTSDTISSQCLEACLLKHLNHPGIPTIYDIEEDQHTIYMVEEYIQGESLDTFVCHQNYISQELIIQFGIQLCDILIYLHSQKPHPILYQDLKPEHIILCGDSLKIIDFGVAAFFTSSSKQFQFYGTKGYAAPEVTAGLCATPQSDLYSLGKVLLFLQTNSSIPCSEQLKAIINKAAAPMAADRYETVACFKSALEQVQIQACTIASHLCKNIIVLGSKHGVGTTHVAISLVSILNQNGYPALYVERNTTDNLRGFTRINSSVSEKDGIYHYKFFQGIPDYGSGIALSLPTDTMTIEDYGVYHEDIIELNSESLLFFVMGSDEWDTEHAILAGLQHKYPERTVFICNHGNKKSAKRLARLLGTKVYCFPCDYDSFTNTVEKEQFFFTILPLKRRASRWLSFLQKLQKNVLSLALPEQQKD